MTGAVDIVFDDVEVVALGELQHPECGALGDAVPGRVLHNRSGDEESRMVRPGHPFQLGQIGAGAGPGHSVNGGAKGPDVSEGLEIARIIHQHHVVGANQITPHQIDRTDNSGGEQDLVRMNVDSQFRQPAPHVLPQRGVSARIAVPREEAARTPKGDSTHGALETTVLQPPRGEPPDTGQVLEMKLASLPAQQPEHVGGLVEPRPSFTRLDRLSRIADEVESGDGGPAKE